MVIYDMIRRRLHCKPRGFKRRRRRSTQKNHKKSKTNNVGETSSKSTIICPICFDHKSKDELFEAEGGCTHKYCKECIKGHITAKVQDNILKIKCPSENCEFVIEPLNCRDVVPQEVLERWESALCEGSIVASEKLYCPFEDCSGLLIMEGDGLTAAECSYCHRLFCAQCRVPWHGGTECWEFEGKRSKEDDLLLELAEKSNWRRCEKCRFFVERSRGCEHITCRCGYEFCILCGRQWSFGHVCKSSENRFSEHGYLRYNNFQIHRSVLRHKPRPRIGLGQIRRRRRRRLIPHFKYAVHRERRFR